MHLKAPSGPALPSSGLGTQKCFNKCSLVDCPQLSLPGLELRARAPPTAPVCEERLCILTSSGSFLENDRSPRGIGASFNLRYIKPPATFQFGARESMMNWELADLEVALAVSPVAVQLWTSHLSSLGLITQRTFLPGSASPQSGSSSLSSADIMAVGVRMGLHPGFHGSLGGASSGPVSAALRS